MGNTKDQDFAKVDTENHSTQKKLGNILEILVD